MTDETEDLPQFSVEDLTPHDFSLEMMVRGFLGDSLEASFTLTVMCGGVIVSGDAISYARWLSGWVDQLEQGTSEDMEELREFVEQDRQDSLKLEKQLDAADQLRPPPRFLHLKDATVSNGSESRVVPYWRGAIRSVDGWWLGKPSPA